VVASYSAAICLVVFFSRRDPIAANNENGTTTRNITGKWLLEDGHYYRYHDEDHD